MRAATSLSGGLPFGRHASRRRPRKNRGMDLFEAYDRILATIDFSKLGEHEVEYDDTPIELHEEDLVDRISRAASKSITLQEAFSGKRRGEVIGLFLATLELVRQRRVRVRQDDVLGEIVLELNDATDDITEIDEDDVSPETNPTPV